MTVMEFLDALAKSPRTWRLVGRGEIQNANADCPALAVCDKMLILTGPGACSPWDVWHAADNTPGHNPVIRRALLDACGLLKD